MFPYFSKFPPAFVQFLYFLPHLRVFFFPLFDHDAFMHRAIHVLDTLKLLARFYLNSGKSRAAIKFSKVYDSSMLL